MANNLFVLDVSIPKKHEEQAESLLSTNVPWGWQEEEDDENLLWRIYFESLTKLDEIARLIQIEIPDSSSRHHFEKALHWQENWKKFFTPIYIDDQIMVVPTWLSDTPFSGMSIIIEPKMAFGTGHHATTTLCLQEINRLFHSGCLNSEDHFLDLGTGSGILGIACAKLGLSGIGLDIESTSIDNARENIVGNKVQSRFEVHEGSLRQLAKEQKFELIVANILANPLINMARDLTNFLSQEKYCLVLSGILLSQADRVIRAYQKQGMGRPLTVTKNEWIAIVWTDQN
ncbi:MAG: 50S ribosomal protein L11 methyltransferase [Thermodesulfobacteriota bacterium]